MAAGLTLVLWKPALLKPTAVRGAEDAQSLSGATWGGNPKPKLFVGSSLSLLVYLVYSLLTLFVLLCLFFHFFPLFQFVDELKQVSQVQDYRFSLWKQKQGGEFL